MSNSLTAAKPDDYYKDLARRVAVPDVQVIDEGMRSENQDERDARRLTERLPPGYKPESGSDMSFDPRLAYELALGLTKPHEVFEKYGLEQERAVELVRTPAFIATVRKYKQEIEEGGVSFRLKAKIQAEDLLTHSYLIATDPETPASVRADLIKWTARVADLEPRDSKEKGAAGGFNLSITFAGEKPGAIITAERIDE